MTTSTDTVTFDQLADLMDAARTVMDHATKHRDFRPDKAFEAVTHAHATLRPNQVRALRGMTPQIAHAYRVVQEMDTTMLCWILARYTDALRHVEDTIEGLAAFRDAGTWISLVEIRRTAESASKSTLEVVVGNMVATDEVEVACDDEDADLPPQFRAARDLAAVYLDGRKVHWLRFTG